MGKSFYIIQGTTYSGLFSHYVRSLCEIQYALEAGKIPIIDMMTYPNMYLCDENVNRMNAWEFFFQQPCRISLADLSKESDYEIGKKPHLTIDPLTTPGYFEWLNDNCTPWHHLRKRYLRLNGEAEEVVSKAATLLERPDCTIGVLCRGSDYVAAKPHRHPVQPTAEEVIGKVRELLDGSACDEILLASEDPTIRQCFFKAFGGRVITFGAVGDYLGYGYRTNDGQTQSERIRNAMDYLAIIMLLSKCRSFICGKTCGSLSVMLQDHRFESLYVFEKGIYP